MSKTKLATVAAIAAIGVGAPGAMAGGTTSITIKATGGDFSGKVTGNPTSCREGRTVKVREQRPGKDKTIASDTTGSDGKWSTGNTGADPGKYYAKVTRTDDCSGAKTGTLTVT